MDEVKVKSQLSHQILSTLPESATFTRENSVHSSFVCPFESPDFSWNLFLRETKSLFLCNLLDNMFQITTVFERMSEIVTFWESKHTSLGLGFVLGVWVCLISWAISSSQFDVQDEDEYGHGRPNFLVCFFVFVFVFNHMFILRDAKLS